MSRAFLLVIGINTGNSLDAADVVLTKFGADQSIVDLDDYSLSMPADLAARLRRFRQAVCDAQGDMGTAALLYERSLIESGEANDNAERLVADYTKYAAQAVNSLLQRSKKKLAGMSPIDLIGFHGQTCAHKPPSISRSEEEPYTVQIGDGQMLADLTGIPVVYDFRSDDLMNGGEAAPLAPGHHEHLAMHLKAQGKFPVAFCNAGNTGNISIISERPDKSLVVFGWDAGPFNEFPDRLMRLERGQDCDRGGECGARGKVNADLLKSLFEHAATTDQGENFLLKPPPKSSDPQWYRSIPELIDTVNGANKISFEDRLRTAEYFSAYVYFYSLRWVPDDVLLPRAYLLCGGGWNNPVVKRHFEQLLHGQFDQAPVIDGHKKLFEHIKGRLLSTDKKPECMISDEYGFSGQFMEARIFADAAVCRVKAVPFTRPETTGCKAPTLLGIIRFPHAQPQRASRNLQQWLDEHNSLHLTPDNPEIFDGRWSRAVAGWRSRLHEAGLMSSVEPA